MQSKGILSRIRSALSMPEMLPSLRRYFVNTIFDATFVMLGVVVGSAFAEDPRLSVIITTLLTSAVSLSISTGSSVFEAESMEQGVRMDRLNRAMLSSMEKTDIGKSSRAGAGLIALFNSLAPLLMGAIIVTPFLVLGGSEIQTAAKIAIGLAIATLFITGFIMGRIGSRNPWVRGARMAIIGAIAFTVCYFIGGAV